MGSKEKLENHLTSSTDLLEFLREKAQHHRCYKWYSNQAYVDAIISESAVYLNTGKNWNDTVDRDLFNSIPGKRRFGLCLSYTQSENVAMWMLYGGKGDRGAMIDYPKSMINHFMNIESIELGKYIDGGFKSFQTIKKENFTVDIIDVLYVAKQDDDYYTIKKSGETIKDVDDVVIDAYNGIKKSYPWNYETECRLIVEIEERAIDEIAKDANQVMLSFKGKEGLLKGRVYHAPNYVPQNNRYKYSRSTMIGEINWNLCYDCSLKEKNPNEVENR